MHFLRDIVTYALLLFLLSAEAIILTVKLLPEPPTTSEDSSVVTRADSWPASKAEHMEEDDFWYWVENTLTKPPQGSSSWTSLLFSSAMGTEANADELHQQGNFVDEFHEVELLVWCLFLPLFVYMVLGVGIAAWKPTSWYSLLATLAGTALLAIYVATFTSDELYFLLWDASIHWANALGWTYYDFTVRFFIYTPALAVLTGIVLGAGAVAHKFWPKANAAAEISPY